MKHKLMAVFVFIVFFTQILCLSKDVVYSNTTGLSEANELNLTCFFQKDNSVLLKWDAPKNISPAGYVIVKNGKNEGISIETSYIVKDLNPGAKYIFQVKTCDIEGKISEVCGEVSFENIDFENRFIIRYSDGKEDLDFNDILKDKCVDIKNIGIGNLNFCALEFKEYVDIEWLKLLFQEETASGEIIYIQPDTRIDLFDDDSFYEEQSIYTEYLDREKDLLLNMLPVHLKELFINNEDLVELISDSSFEELRCLEDIPFGISRDVFLELIHDPVILDLQTIVQRKFNSNEAVVKKINEKSPKKAVKAAVIGGDISMVQEDKISSRWINDFQVPGSIYLDDTGEWDFLDDSSDIDSSDGWAEAFLRDVKVPVKIMFLKAFYEGKAHTSDILEAIAYAESMGTEISFLCCGSLYNNVALEDAVLRSDMQFVFADGYIANDTIYIAEQTAYSVLSEQEHFSKVSAGYYHSLALREDGIVLAFGQNIYGQLGDGTTVERNEPVQVTGLSTVIKTSAGYYHNLAIKEDKTVWAWGRNNYGQLGDGTSIDRTIPVQVSGLTGVMDISAGESHSLALKEDGTVWAWGQNNNGQLGDGTTLNRSIPVQVGTLTGVVEISSGFGHNFALKEDATVWSWGHNNYGQLGDGTTTTRYSPVQPAALTCVKSATAGYGYSLVVKEDSTVLSFGYNNYGQLGDGTTTNRITPTQISGLSGADHVKAGYNHSVFIMEDKTIWTCGYNYYGQLGDGTTVNRSMPVPVNGLDSVICISAGNYFTIAVNEDTTIWAFGYNYFGQLGRMTGIEVYPEQIAYLSDISKIDGGSGHSIVMTENGDVYTSGYNGYGQLGDGTTVNRNEFDQISTLNGICDISGNYNSNLALNENGTVWAWGYNYGGQLGDGTTIDRYTPVQVSGLTGVSAIDKGGGHGLALKSNGTVWAWGRNNEGQLGDGTNYSRSTPVQVSNLSGVIAVAAGEDHSLALKSNGTVWTFGVNYNGQLGIGTLNHSNLPVQTVGANGITAIASGSYHSFAIDGDTMVYAWGNNNYGQIGDGTRINKLSPVQTAGLSGIMAVAGGYGHSLAVDEDGGLWAWGYNFFGQLGNSKAAFMPLPAWMIGTPRIVEPIYPELKFIFSVNDQETFNNKVYKVEYDTDDLEVADLCAFSFDRETYTGSFEGMNITVIQNDPGIIRFQVDRIIPSGMKWSGVINIIIFRNKVSHDPVINYCVE